jgi:hypothetical protein
MKRLLICLLCLANVYAQEPTPEEWLIDGTVVGTMKPKPKPTPFPTPTPTPATPTPTATPSPTATPTASPSPTSSPTPSSTPTPTASPSPTATPTASASPSPTVTPTATATPTPGSIPIVPSDLTATAAGPTQINLNWSDNSNNETGFRVLRSTAPNSGYVLIFSPAANATTYRDETVAPSTTYYYLVRAYNSIGGSITSNSASATTPATATPSPTPTPSSVQVTVTWAPTAGDSYKLYYGITSGQYIYVLPVGTTGSYTLNGLTPLTTYYFALTAIRNGTESLKSAEVPYTTTLQLKQRLQLPFKTDARP